MGAELPVIPYVANRYTDAVSISRIRSHAMRKVQQQKKQNMTESSEIESSDLNSPVHLGFQLRGSSQFSVFKRTGNELIDVSQRLRHRGGTRKDKPVFPRVENIFLVMDDPFNSFPVRVDARSLELFDRCKLFRCLSDELELTVLSLRRMEM